jgi:catechol 2,3-dioxygenase-like lactoylglutathione lyase family enzyme
MTSQTSAAIECIDHGVVPSNDLGQAYRFWSKFMGGEIDHLTNFNLRGLNREVPQIIFFTVANHRGFGVALQDFPIPSVPARTLEGVVWGFEVAAAELSDIIRAAEERKLSCHGPVKYPVPSPIKESLFLLDPDGNTVELCIRRHFSNATPQGSVVPLRRISHVRVEVTDLGWGRRWYRETFGLAEKEQVPGEDQITLTVPKSGQLVILRQVDRVAERSTRSIKGPHIDFRIAPEHYPTIFQRFDRKEYYWDPDPTKIPWHEPGRQTVYGYDPFGNRIQIGEVFDRPAPH